MVRKLTAGVVLRHPSSGALEFLASGSDLPEWAAPLVGDHVLTSDDEPDTETDIETEPDPPPLAGAGSSRTVWAGYAEANGVEVSAGMGRDEIVTACRAAGVPVE